MKLFSVAHRRLRMIVMPAVAVVALAALAVAMPGILQDNNDQGIAALVSFDL